MQGSATSCHLLISPENMAVDNGEVAKLCFRYDRHRSTRYNVLVGCRHVTNCQGFAGDVPSLVMSVVLCPATMCHIEADVLAKRWLAMRASANLMTHGLVGIRSLE